VYALRIGKCLHRLGSRNILFSIVPLVGSVAALLAVDGKGTGTGGGEERWTDDGTEYWFEIGACGFVAAGGWAAALGSLSSSLSSQILQVGYSELESFSCRSVALLLSF
jgi:hypothetical protein